MNEKMVVHCQRAHFDVLIDRTTKWGNPYTHIKDRRTLAQFLVATRQEAVDAYEPWLRGQPELMTALPELRGKVLGCWCDPNPLCHGHTLVRLANASKCCAGDCTLFCAVRNGVELPFCEVHAKDAHLFRAWEES